MRLAIAAIATFAAAAPALAEDLVFTLVNDSSVGIVEMYVSPVDQDSWGPNILSVDVVPPGVAGDVTIADGSDACEYDMRFVADNGATLEATHDICAMASYTLTD